MINFIKYSVILFAISPYLYSQDNKVILSKNDSSNIANQKELNEKSKKATLEELSSSCDGKLNKIANDFTLKKNSGTSEGWYHYNSNLIRAPFYITAPVSTKGHIYIKAKYTGSKFINCTRIRVKIKNHSWETKPLLKESKYITRKNSGSVYYETLNLFSYKNGSDFEVRSMMVISAIANSNIDDEITIVFIGEEENVEVKLSNDNIKAIKKCWELSQCITFGKNNYSSYTYVRGKHGGITTILIPNDGYTQSDMAGTVD